MNFTVCEVHEQPSIVATIVNSHPTLYPQCSILNAPKSIDRKIHETIAMLISVIFSRQKKADPCLCVLLKKQTQAI